MVVNESYYQWAPEVSGAIGILIVSRVYGLVAFCSTICGHISFLVFKPGFSLTTTWHHQLKL